MVLFIASAFSFRSGSTTAGLAVQVRSGPVG
jgi:hypothetical protein